MWDHWVDDHVDVICWAAVAAANFGAVFASVPLTLLKHQQHQQQGSQQALETSVVIALAVAGFVPILQMQDDVQRAMAFLMQVELVARVSEVAVEDAYDGDKSLGERMLHCLVSPEELARRKTPSEMGRKKWEMVAQRAVEAAGMVVMSTGVTAALKKHEHWLASHWVLCALFAVRTWAVLSLNGKFIQVMFLVFDGTHVMGLMDKPFLSLSLHEFWSKRWNLPVHHLLKRYVYTPLRRTFGVSRQLAIVLVFLASGLYHVSHLAVGGVGKSDLLGQMYYFLLQGLLVIVEANWTTLQKQDPIVQWLWTFTCILGPVTLFSPSYMRLEGFQE